MPEIFQHFSVLQNGLQPLKIAADHTQAEMGGNILSIIFSHLRNSCIFS